MATFSNKPKQQYPELDEQFRRGKKPGSSPTMGTTSPSKPSTVPTAMPALATAKAPALNSAVIDREVAEMQAFNNRANYLAGGNSKNREAAAGRAMEIAGKRQLGQTVRDAERGVAPAAARVAEFSRMRDEDATELDQLKQLAMAARNRDFARLQDKNTPEEMLTLAKGEGLTGDNRRADAMLPNQIALGQEQVRGAGITNRTNEALGPIQIQGATGRVKAEAQAAEADARNAALRDEKTAAEIQQYKGLMGPTIKEATTRADVIASQGAAAQRQVAGVGGGSSQEIGERMANTEAQFAEAASIAGIPSPDQLKVNEATYRQALDTAKQVVSASRDGAVDGNFWGKVGPLQAQILELDSYADKLVELSRTHPKQAKQLAEAAFGVNGINLPKGRIADGKPEYFDNETDRYQSESGRTERLGTTKGEQERLALADTLNRLSPKVRMLLGPSQVATRSAAMEPDPMGG